MVELGGIIQTQTIEFWTTSNGATSGNERMRIHSGGVVSIPNGIELGSGVDATVANTLDDYEEGTWTPVMNKSGVGGTAGTPSTVLRLLQKSRQTALDFILLV